MCMQYFFKLCFISVFYTIYNIYNYNIYTNIYIIIALTINDYIQRITLFKFAKDVMWSRKMVLQNRYDNLIRLHDRIYSRNKCCKRWHWNTSIFFGKLVNHRSVQTLKRWNCFFNFTLNNFALNTLKHLKK